MAGGAVDMSGAKTRASVEAIAKFKGLDPTFLRERFTLRNHADGLIIPYY